jgi:hypothetical protein
MGCGLNRTETDTAIISQDGQNVKVDIPSENIIAEGILRGYDFTATNPPYSFPLLGGIVTITEVSVTFSNDGNSASLSGIGTYTGIGGNTCEITITAPGAKEPATDRIAHAGVFYNHVSQRLLNASSLKGSQWRNGEANVCRLICEAARNGSGAQSP